MKSFSFGETSVPTKIKVPSGHIPLIIAQRLYDDYYGGGISIYELRVFLEPKFRDELYPQDVVTAWIRKAEHFAAILEQKHPGSVNRILREYFQLQNAA